MEKPKIEKNIGGIVEISTQVETYNKGNVRAKWEEGENVAIPPGFKWTNVDP